MMHNYNFVDIQINEDKDMEQVYFYTIENNNICSENLKEIKQYEDFLKNKENIIAIENNKYVNIGYINKEKNVEIFRNFNLYSFRGNCPAGKYGLLCSALSTN